METIPASISDREIIALLSSVDGNRKAIEYLYRQYFELSVNFVLNNSGTRTDAQDNFQEVVIAFVHAVQQHKFRGESSIKTFLYALNKNLWLNELKRRSRAQKREERYGRSAEEARQTADRIIEHREAGHQLMAIMNGLGEKCRQILLLYYYENRSMKEIATQTAYENEQVVRNKKYKCLKSLEQKLVSNPSFLTQLKNLLHG